MAEDPPIPAVLAFLLCDQIVTEAQTNKKSIIGMFDRMLVATLPAIHPQPIWIYVKLADGEGEYVYRIEIIKLDSGQAIGRIDTHPTQIKSRLESTDIVLKIPPMAIEELGVYEFQLFANNIWIGRTMMNVVQVPPGGPQS